MKPPLHNNNSHLYPPSTFTATVSLSQQQSPPPSSLQQQSSFINPLLQPAQPQTQQQQQQPNTTTTTSATNANTTTTTTTQIHQSLSSSSLNNIQDNNVELPRKESINILFSRKESFYTLPADGSTPLLTINNSPPSQSISPSTTYMNGNSNTYNALRRDSFNLPYIYIYIYMIYYYYYYYRELTLGPPATDIELYMRNSDLHSEHQ